MAQRLRELGLTVPVNLVTSVDHHPPNQCPLITFLLIRSLLSYSDKCRLIRWEYVVLHLEATRSLAALRPTHHHHLQEDWPRILFQSKYVSAIRVNFSIFNWLEISPFAGLFDHWPRCLGESEAGPSPA